MADSSKEMGKQLFSTSTHMYFLYKNPYPSKSLLKATEVKVMTLKRDKISICLVYKLSICQFTYTVNLNPTGFLYGKNWDSFLVSVFFFMMPKSNRIQNKNLRNLLVHEHCSTKLLNTVGEKTGCQTIKRGKYPVEYLHTYLLGCSDF